MSIRILIINNEPHWINFIQADLGGFEVVVAQDLDAARKELCADQFNLVIASSGYLAILEVITERFADKRVVVTTVKPNTQEILCVYRKGAKSILRNRSVKRIYCETSAISFHPYTINNRRVALLPGEGMS